jgi:hypothetical protein
VPDGHPLLRGRRSRALKTGTETDQWRASQSAITDFTGRRGAARGVEEYSPESCSYETSANVDPNAGRLSVGSCAGVGGAALLSEVEAVPEGQKDLGIAARPLDHGPVRYVGAELLDGSDAQGAMLR